MRSDFSLIIYKRLKKTLLWKTYIRARADGKELFLIPTTMTTSKTPKTTNSKKKIAINASQSVAQSQKRQLRANASMSTTSKHARVEDSDKDEELEYVGETLSSDEDAIMEPVDAGSKKVGAGSTGDPIKLTNAEEAEEDEDSKISEPTVILF